MEYERIDKSHHQSGGLSPGKLRSMLLGVEKKRKEEEVESGYAMESRFGETGDCISDNCKDVDVVCEVPECSISSAVDPVAVCVASEYRSKDQSYINSRIKPQDNLSLDHDNSHDVMAVSSSIFEFQKAERAGQRVSLAPFSKPAPSKWDDAHKWIASPTSNRPKTGQSHALVGQGVGSRKMGSGCYLTRQPSTKVVMEVPDKKIVTAQEPDTKWVDTDQIKKETGVQKFLPWETDSHPAADSYGKSVLMIENSVGRPTISLSQHGSSIAAHSTTAFIPAPSTARSVSMRDMGTEMTPIASQEPSRAGTPVRATTPIRSPTSSVPSSPTGATQSSSPLTNPFSDHLSSNKDLSEKELQMKTRKEIMILGTKLGKMNIAAWASKEEEDKDASTSLKTVVTEKSTKSVIETRAAAWEEAEKAKYMARFKREEMKIQAWENHQKAKTEAEMRKIEVEVERIRGRAQDKLMNKLAAARHKAEGKRAAAESKRNRHAAKTEQQADYIRKTGRIPSSFSFCGWCF